MVAVVTARQSTSAERAVRLTPMRPVIRLSMLDGFELTQDGRGIPLSIGPQRLLAFLGLHERSQVRGHVAGVLWADVSDDRAAGNLRSVLWRLNRLELNLVEAAHDRLRLSSEVVVDVRNAARLAEQIMDPTVDVCSLDLVELHLQGELLPGWYEDWIILERERQRQIYLHTLEVLCERWARAGLYVKAVLAGLAAVAGEPLRESANKALIKTYLAEGNPVEAIRQYRLYRDILQNELNLEPSQELSELMGHLWAQ
jgi:DNA-binding SARP family transcriptional activator